MKLRSRAISVLSAVVTLASAGGLVALYVPSEARAAGETESAVTVEWAGGNGDLQRFQPDRSGMVDDADGSGHWDDFKDLEVTVSQTEGLIDQAITVSAAGMPPTERDFGAGGVRNFLQVMQCWGADPNDADFAETCQWGGFHPEEVGGAEALTSVTSVFTGNAFSVVNRGDRLFRSVAGQENEPTDVPVPGGGVQTNTGLGAFFNASSSNELPFVPIAADGTAEVGFNVQSGASQPYLGCGDPEAAGERCWLVVVPRGVHSGSLADGTNCGAANAANNEFGGTPAVQIGSPLSEACSYWDDRVVVPLDFLDPFQACPPGSEERRLAGSEALAEAMSSWQSSLCAGDGATYSLNTNSGNLVRSQLLTGQVDLAAVSVPLRPGTIGQADPGLLDEADLGYAPLVNTALTIGFIADGDDGTVYDELRLTPRLIAKMLTQSYKYDLPRQSSANTVPNSKSFEALTSETVVEDEEWVALGNPSIFSNAARASWVVSGPRGDDAISLLWAYVQADADAVAYLRGEADPWGNVINPSYLPAGHPRAVGGGYSADLSREAIDMFPKADQSLYPDEPTADAQHRSLQIDSTSYSPYSETLEANAQRIARADRKMTNTWDPTKFAGMEQGVWTDGGGPDLPGSPVGRLILGPALAPSSELYQLRTASLALPTDEPTTAETVASEREFVAYGEQSVSRALEAATLDERGVTTIDMTSLPDGAYPLTTTINAAVDLGWERVLPTAYPAERQARTDYAALLEYAATDGNAVTGERGGLPEGYVPLTAEQQEAALDLSGRLLLAPPPEPGSGGGGPDGDGADGGDGSGSGKGAPGNGGGSGDDPADTAATVPVPEDGADPAGRTPPPEPDGAGGPNSVSTTQNETAVTEDTAPLGASVALGGTLVAGLAGMVGAPFLLRRRDVSG